MVSLLGELCEVGLFLPDFAVAYLDDAIEYHENVAIGAIPRGCMERK
jgi:hypothetical protein